MAMDVPETTRMVDDLAARVRAGKRAAEDPADDDERRAQAVAPLRGREHRTG